MDDITIKKWDNVQSLDSKTDWYRYYLEYNSAIENIIEQSDKSQTTVLGIPLLFLIRNSLELAFKYNLIELEKISKSKAIIDYSGRSAHVLSKLHNEYERQVKLIMNSKFATIEFEKDFKSRNNELKDFTVMFDKLDNWSYSFRYPVQNDGITKSFLKDEKINMAEIIPVYIKTQIILKYTIDVLKDDGNFN
ncbi:hypothetical protein [Flavobacterium sp. RSSB_23]|uniref:hypothetical protein n=1 Tax=Flavobacterium sp. RSSB_23 TaxID=3447668 RepID=UPI003F33A135